jgi:hypothetical protein
MFGSTDKEHQPEQSNSFASSDDLGPDAKPLCPACLRPVETSLYYYCPYCGSSEPINPLTAYMPWVRLRYMYSIFGTMWRKLWQGKTNPFLAAVFVVLIFALAPIIFIAGAPVMLYRLLKEPPL